MMKILLADNSNSFLRDFGHFLTLKNYQVDFANSPSSAVQLLENGWYPVAIVDIRLTDDDEPYDQSGITQVAAKFPYSKIILVSNFVSPVERNRIQEILYIQPIRQVVKLVIKQDGFEAVSSALEDALAHHVHINFDLEIDWGTNLHWGIVESLCEKNIAPELIPSRIDEFQDLLGRVFFDFTRVKIHELLWQEKQLCALSVTASKPSAASQHFLLLVGAPQTIQRQREQHAKHKPPFPSDFDLPIFSEDGTTHFESIAYILSNGAAPPRLRTLKNVFDSYESKPFEDALRTLSNEVLPHWQIGRTHIARSNNLDQFISSPTEDEIYKLRTRLRRLLQQTKMFDIEARFTDENKILVENAKGIKTYEDPLKLLGESLESNGVMAPTPGCFSADAVLVDSQGNVLLTDFRDAADASIFTSHAFLEAQLRFDWPEFEQPFVSNLLILEERLCRNDDFFVSDIQDVSRNTQRILRAIRIVRNSIKDALSKNHRDYWLLVYQFGLRRLSELDDPDTQMQDDLLRGVHLILAMSIIATNIDKALSQKKYHLVFDSKANVFLRNSTPCKLGGEPFALLKYLYERAGEFCSSEEICNDLRGKSDQTEQNWLKTNIERVRKEIEPDPNSKSRIFLITDPKGYHLVTSV